MRCRQDEAVASAAFEPVRHLIGDLLAGADEAGTLQQGGAMAGQIPQGNGVPTDMGPQVFSQSPNTGDQRNELFGDRFVEIVLREVLFINSDNSVNDAMG